MTTRALAEWCQRSGTGTVFISPGAPWRQSFVESFHSRMRDQLLNVEALYSLAETRVVIFRAARGLQHEKAPQLTGNDGPRRLHGRLEGPSRLRPHELTGEAW